MKAAALTALLLLAFAAALTVFNLADNPADDERLFPLLERGQAWPHRHLMQLPPERRVALLGDVVGSAGHPCAATDAAFLGMRADTAYHHVSCRSGTGYIVALQGDERGSTYTVPCGRMVAAGLACPADWRQVRSP
jgi:hypothetical protein